uniref:Uncharacterized protein n=1 Tax=Magallana gigas TaxID=29159 RepID=A0A8W8I1K0_MAGGI
MTSRRQSAEFHVKTRQREKSDCKIIKMEMCTGEDNLRQQKERMDKLSELKRKLRAYQYLENLRNEVLADSLFRTEEKVERQQEEPVVSESRRVIIFAKIEAQILKRIIPSNRNAVMVVKWMKMRTRRCPQMAGKMMKKLQDRHLDLKNLQEELMKRVNEREKIRQAKKTIEEELLMEINRKEEMTKRRKMLQMELMSYHFERTIEEDTLFIPRKLFLTGVETFKTVPKLDDAPRDVNERKDGPSASFSYEDQPQPQSQPKKGTKTKLTLKSRIKRIFGFR